MTTYKEVMPGVFNRGRFNLKASRRSIKRLALNTVKDPVFQAVVITTVVCAFIVLNSLLVAASYSK